MWPETGGGAVTEMICRPLSADVQVGNSISENIVQVIMTINGILSSLFLYCVLICLHESPFVLYYASRETKNDQQQPL